MAGMIRKTGGFEVRESERFLGDESGESTKEGDVAGAGRGESEIREIGTTSERTVSVLGVSHSFAVKCCCPFVTA